MQDFAECPSGELMLSLLLHGLRVDDPQLNEAAAELLTRFGGEPLRRLVRAALDRRNAADHRLRVLAVLGRIGPAAGPDPLGLMDLSLLLGDRDARLRAAARRVLRSGGPGR